MKLHELHHQIVSSSFDKLYIMFGEEVGIMDIYLNKLYSGMGADVVRVNAVADVYSKLAQRTLSNTPRCFVVRDDKEFFKNEKVWGRVFAAVQASSDYLVLIYATMDKRSKFYKSNMDTLTEFEKLDAEMLSSYIRKELQGISARAAITLANVCECNYNRILLECDKIRAFVSAENRNASAGSNYTDATAHLISTGIIFKPIGDITFQLTDAILTRNMKAAGEYLLQARQKNEPEIMVLSILYNGFKHILLVQGLGEDQREPSKRTGLTPWQVKLAKEKKGHYQISELINALRVIRFVEKGIKTGQIDAEVSLEYAIAKIM